MSTFFQHVEAAATLRDLHNRPVAEPEATGPFIYVCPSCKWRSATTAGVAAARQFGKLHNHEKHGGKL